MLLRDRVAVVTGAGRGIGQAITTLFVRHGARVVAADLDEGPVQETRALCEAITPGACVGFVGSVTDRAATDALMKRASDHFGQLDILINNAGVTRDRMLHNLGDDEWSLVVDTSLRGTFNCIRSAAPYMREVAKRELETSGAVSRVRKIVNFGSTAAIRGNPGQAAYTAAKMGVVGLTRTVAQEWGRFRICANVVAPGFTETRLTAAKKPGDTLGIPEEQRSATLARIPFGRFGTPEDIADVVLFFASPLSDYVTGQEINVSGGLQIP